METVDDNDINSISSNFAENLIIIDDEQNSNNSLNEFRHDICPSENQEIGNGEKDLNNEILITAAEPIISIGNKEEHSINRIIKMPENIKTPIAIYYCPISWAALTNWSLVRFSTPMDNNCLFHSIANSFFSPYYDENLNGKHITRQQIVTYLRKELSKKLASKINPSDSNSLRYYDILNGGNTSAFAEAVPEFKLEYMQEQLNSQVPIGYGYMEFIGDTLNKDIYILEAARKDIYNTDELPLTIKGDRRSIILYYMNGHYELVGIHNSNGTFDTHFDSNHSLIRFLNNRVQQLVAEHR